MGAFDANLNTTRCLGQENLSHIVQTLQISSFFLFLTKPESIRKEVSHLTFVDSFVYRDVNIQKFKWKQVLTGTHCLIFIEISPMLYQVSFPHFNFALKK
jgi:hypothetical protein